MLAASQNNSASLFSQRTVLVIDDIASMRNQLTKSLSVFGFERIWAVGGSQEALAQIAKTHFDLILCDYHLGEETSGQQFLEHLRARHVIDANTAFVIVTARRAYEDVMRVAEHAPDDYLVKPYTNGQLESRIAKVLEKRERFAPVNAAMESRDWSNAVRYCNAIIAARDRYAVDAMKIKGQALFNGEQYIEAEALYRQVLAERPLAWARLGLARVLKAMNSLDRAEAELIAIIAEGRKNSATERMGAYDELVDVLQATRRNSEALAVLEDAMNASPGTLARNRKLTRLAFSEGKLELAEKTARKIAAEQMHSDIKEVGDFLLAAEVLSAAGKGPDALAIVEEAKDCFQDQRALQALTVAEGNAHVTMGATAVAHKLFQSIDAASIAAMDPETAAALGKGLYRVGDQEEGEKILKHLVQNHPDDPTIARTVQDAMASVGLHEQARNFVETSLREAAEINNEGVRLAYADRLQEAIELLTRAADAAPGNLQFVSNAALVIALALSKKKIDRNMIEVCLRYRKLLAKREPRHPKLEQIDYLLKLI